MNSLVEQLRRDEGERLMMYKDSKDIATIGIGHNLETTPISKAASEQIFNDDVADRVKVVSTWPVWGKLDPIRQEVLLNISFWAGVEGLGGFHHMLFYATQGDWENAAANIENSDLSKIDPGRAQRLAVQMRTGVRQ